MNNFDFLVGCSIIDKRDYLNLNKINLDYFSPIEHNTINLNLLNRKILT